MPVIPRTRSRCFCGARRRCFCGSKATRNLDRSRRKTGIPHPQEARIRDDKLRLSVSRLTSHALDPALPVACILTPAASVSCPSVHRSLLTVHAFRPVHFRPTLLRCYSAVQLLKPLPRTSDASDTIMKALGSLTERNLFRSMVWRGVSTQSRAERFSWVNPPSP